MNRPTKEQARRIHNYLKLLVFIHHDRLTSLSVKLGHGHAYLLQLTQTNPERLAKIVPYMSANKLHQLINGSHEPFQLILDTLERTAKKSHDKGDLKRYAKGLAFAHGTTLAKISKSSHHNFRSMTTAYSYDKEVALVKQLKEHLSGWPIKPLSKLKPDYTLTAKQTKLAKNYLRLLVLYHHDTCNAISKRKGHSETYISWLLLTRPRYLPNVVPYLSQKTFDYAVSGNKMPFIHILNKMQTTAERTHKCSDIKRLVQGLVYANGSSIYKIEKAYGHKSAYIGTALQSNNRYVVEPILKRIAKYLGISMNRFHKILAEIPYGKRNYYRKRHVLKKEKRRIRPGQHADRKLLLNYMKLEEHLHHDSYTKMLHRTLGSDIPPTTTVMTVSEISLVDRVAHFMPYLNRNDLQKITFGDATPLKATLAKLSHDVDSRKSYKNFVCAVIYAHGFRPNKISVRMGHTQSFVSKACRENSMPTLIDNMRSCAHIMNIDPAILTKPIKQIKGINHYVRSIGAESGHVNWKLVKLRKQIIPVFHRYSHHFQVTNGALSKRIFNDKKAYCRVSMKAPYHCYYAVKKMIKVTGYEPIEAKRYCQKIKDYYKPNKR